MKRLMLTVLCGALISVPVAAQQVQQTAPAPSTIAKLDLRKVVFDAAKQTAQPGQTTPRRTAASNNGNNNNRILYAVSLAAAAGGTIYNIKETREGLDRKLQVRTFPLVWIKTSDPADKGKVTALVAGVNGALMVVSGFAYHGRNPGTAILINLLVAAATIGVGLNDRSKINDDKVRCPVVSACR